MIELVFRDDDDAPELSGEAHALIREICDATEPEVRALLPSLVETVALTVQTGTFVIPDTGEVGVAEAPGHVIWTVDPARPEGVVSIARSHLRHSLFHELHHLVRGWTRTGGSPRTTFMEGVVSEGLATAFERDFSGFRPPWGEYPEEVEDWVAEVLELPPSAPYQQWMFYHPDGRFWIGYRAGTYIVDRAIAASGRSAAELVTTSTDEILELAGVDGGQSS